MASGPIDILAAGDKRLEQRLPFGENTSLQDECRRNGNAALVMIVAVASGQRRRFSRWRMSQD
jgi:hypothetical protein